MQCRLNPRPNDWVPVGQDEVPFLRAALGNVVTEEREDGICQRQFRRQAARRCLATNTDAIGVREARQAVGVLHQADVIAHVHTTAANPTTNRTQFGVGIEPGLLETGDDA
ncbi:MAG TPA: hypothetical protein VJT10_24055, partial [Steroidobacteraceae bacterium]|nr:hypothetical protein [Steroidobacteraceae bacterium]